MFFAFLLQHLLVILTVFSVSVMKKSKYLTLTCSSLSNHYGCNTISHKCQQLHNHSRSLFSHCNTRCTVWWNNAGHTTLKSGRLSLVWETRLKLSCRMKERTLKADKEPCCTSQLNSVWYYTISFILPKEIYFTQVSWGKAVDNTQSCKTSAGSQVFTKLLPKFSDKADFMLFSQSYDMHRCNDKSF